MSTPALNPNDYLAWIRFEDRSASLRRALAPNGQKYLVLIVHDRERLEHFRSVSGDCGMVQVGDKPVFRAPIDSQGYPPVPVRQMASILGGKLFGLKLTDFAGPDYTINLAPRPTDTPGEAPKPKAMELLGINLWNEQVLRDETGERFIRKPNRDGREGTWLRSMQGDRNSGAASYLLAQSAADFDGIASAIVNAGRKGTIHKDSFDRLMDIALEHWGDIRQGIDQTEARRQIALRTLRRIGEESIQDGASAEKLHGAMRIANATNFVLATTLEGSEGFTPSPMMAVFLRRLVRDGMNVDFQGNEVLAATMPRSRSETSNHQLHDLTDVNPDRAQERIANIIARRPVNGHSVLILRGSADSEHIDALRRDLALQYAFESVAEITPAIAEGLQDGEPSTVIVVGARRPERLEALPQAAMRTFPVLSTDDLISLERETLRSRMRIRDFHQGIKEEVRQREEDAREENIRQRPYQALSRVTEPFSMVPIALEGATTMALDRLRRDFEERGGIDAAVAFGLGLSLEDLGSHLTSEQVDAVALRMHAAERNRGFLVADQTGIGKGRTLAAIAAEEMRNKGKKVLYFTESAAINVRDVTRDLLGVGVRIVDYQSLAAQDGEVRVAFLSNGSVFDFERTDQATGVAMEDKITSLPNRQRAEIMQGGVWPEGADIIITNYSQFNFKQDHDKAAFLEAVDENTVVILDESHNALNPRSNVGRNIRSIIERAGHGNVVYGTATFARSSVGLDLYRPLLPTSIEDDFFPSIQSGGEVALETFSSMLAQDGALVRRDHDLSNIEILISIPDDATMARYQSIMDKFSPVVEMMIDASGAISEHLGRASARSYREARANGLSEQAARAQSNELNQFSIGIGTPLSMIARIAMNAVRIDQMVDETLAEIDENRKPMITFHSTSEALLREFVRGEDGRISEELMGQHQHLTFRDQMHRFHEAIYRIRVNGEVADARDVYDDVREIYELVRDRIMDIPDNLPVSPIDALIERLEAHGYSVGEISGRTLCYRDAQIVRRQGRDRSKTIDGFNDGSVDILIYNGAGATGGSYHASPHIKDQRPRTMLEFEPPLDPIKYIQSLGRGNRYGQVAKPRIKSVVTGLTPELRIMQQRNNKLRMLGASVDGNRAHPMLLDDVPDLLNKVGDEAARNVLLSLPAMARRLGFPEFAEDNRQGNQNAGNEAMDMGVGDVRGIDSLSNKVLSRSLSLTARDQGELVQRIVVEFEALIEELDSRNANPLRPKQLEGEIEVRDTALYRGEEREEGDIDISAFTSPLYLKTAVHHFNDAAWGGEKLLSEIEASQRLYGVDGFHSWAERIEQSLPMLLRSYLPENFSMEQALEDPTLVGGRFERNHERLTNLQFLLENIRPGVAMRFPTVDDEFGELTRVVVGVQPPRHSAMFDTPAAYRIKTISAGDAKPEVTSLSRITRINPQHIIFSPGLSEGINERFMETFDQQALLTRRLPVQILTGNVLTALQEARRHNLGTVSLYRDTESRVHRGIVVSRNKIDLTRLPVEVPNGQIAAEAAAMYLDRENLRDKTMSFYISMDPERHPKRESEEDMIVRIVRGRRAILDVSALRKSTFDFFAERPGLFEAIRQEMLPARDDIRVRKRRAANHKPIEVDITNEQGRNRLLHILAALGDTPIIANGEAREAINDATILVNRIRDGYAINPAAEPGETPDEAAEGDPEQDDRVDPEEVEDPDGLDITFNL